MARLNMSHILVLLICIISISITTGVLSQMGYVNKPFSVPQPSTQENAPAINQLLGLISENLPSWLATPLSLIPQLLGLIINFVSSYGSIVSMSGFLFPITIAPGIAVSYIIILILLDIIDIIVPL